MSNFKLNEHQEAWLTALESGNYKQGGKRLRVNDTFCCLGVACEVLGIAGREEKNVWVYGEGVGDIFGLPEEAMQKLHMFSDSGRIFMKYDDLPNYPNEDSDTGSKAGELVELNDDAGWSFKQIAAFIRANPEAIFEKGAE